MAVANPLSRWNTISRDELEHREQSYEADVNQPRRTVVRWIDEAITNVLRQLGVDCDHGDIQQLLSQQELGIEIHDMTPEQLAFMCRDTQQTYNEKALGFYIYQFLVPVAFIADPKENYFTKEVLISGESYLDKVTVKEYLLKL